MDFSLYTKTILIFLTFVYRFDSEMFVVCNPQLNLNIVNSTKLVPQLLSLPTIILKYIPFKNSNYYTMVN